MAVKIRKTDANTLFVGEKLAEFAGVSAKNMSYAGLKDRHAVTEQWFCLHLAGKETPDFSQFQLDGVEIVEVTRHNRKIRVGSLAGNHFELLLREVKESDDLTARLQQIDLSLKLDNCKKILYKEIQQAWYNALAAESKYNSALS